MKKFNTDYIHRMTLENGGHTAGQVGRFMVALPGYEKQVNLKNFTSDSISDYIEQVFPDYTAGATIGTWIDTETDIVYIDTSVAYDDKDEAIHAGIEYKQVAIYDVLEAESIYLRNYKK